MKRTICIFVAALMSFSAVTGESTLEKLSFFNSDGTIFEFEVPSSVQHIGQNWFVLDTGVGVFEFGADRKLVRKLYGIGQGPTELAARTAFMVAQNKRLLVPDTFNGRLMTYSPETGKYDTVRTPEMTFVTNGFAKGDAVYIGGQSHLFCFENGRIARTRLPDTGSQMPELILVAKDGSGLRGVSMLLHGQDTDQVHLWRLADGNPVLSRSVVASTEQLDKWKQTVRLPLFFTSAVCADGHLLATCRLDDQEKGAVIYDFGPDGETSRRYLNGIHDALFSPSGEEVFVIDTYSAEIYRFHKSGLN